MAGEPSALFPREGGRISAVPDTFVRDRQRVLSAVVALEFAGPSFLLALEYLSANSTKAADAG